MVSKLITHYYRYLKQGDEEKASEYRMRVDLEKKNVARQLGSLKTTFINADVRKLTRGAIMKEVVQGRWVVINPLTKTHCVSDCLAILELYRGEQALVAVKSHIKNRGNQIAEKYDMREGCPESLLQKISEDFKVNIAIGADKDYEELTEDAYLIVEDEHCYICLNPENERSHQIKDLIARLYTERAKIMPLWHPQEKRKTHFVAYDWEYFDEEPLRIPYGFGIYTEQLKSHEEIYKHFFGVEGILDEFVTKLSEACDNLLGAYIPVFDEIKRVEKEEARQRRLKKNKGVEESEESVEESDQEYTKYNTKYPLNIVLGAHNGFKADFPLIRKKLLEANCVFESAG